MAKVDARKCENEECSKIVMADEAVEITTRFKGKNINGSYKRELCEECASGEIPEGIELTPPKSNTGVRDQQEGNTE